MWELSDQGRIFEKRGNAERTPCSARDLTWTKENIHHHLQKTK